MILKYNDIVATNPDAGITRRILARGSTMMGVEASFEAGAVGSVHKHLHEQVSYIVSGVFEYEADGIKHRLETGDSYYVESNLEHGAVCLEKGIILDVFSPQRKDFL